MGRYNNNSINESYSSSTNRKRRRSFEQSTSQRYNRDERKQNNNGNVSNKATSSTIHENMTNEEGLRNPSVQTIPNVKQQETQIRKEMEKILSEEEQAKAAEYARIAARAEERALERARLRKIEKEAALKSNDQPTVPITALSVKTKVADVQAEMKPKFKSRKEREKEALERLEAKRKAQQDRLINQQNKRKEYEALQRKRIREEQEEMSRNRTNYRSKRNKAEQQHETTTDDGTPDPRILNAIKQQYLGVKKEKKKSVRLSEKRSKIFQFEWDNSEDTSKDYNPIYSQRADASLLFGRGYRGGVDKREQRKNSEYLIKLMSLRHNGELTQAQLNAKRRELEELEDVRLKSMEKQVVHWKDKALHEMTVRDWRIVREDFDIYVKGGRIPHPARDWKEMKLPDTVLRAIQEMGFEKPSPIQMQAVPIGMNQRDIIGVAETGSGKTAAFVLPMLMYVLRQGPEKMQKTEEDGPLAVIMAPTRELAQQIEEQTIKLAKYTGIRTVSVVGGNSITEQGFKLRQGCEIVVATPGRLLDCLRNHYVVFNQCNYLVLDEADKMIDMGFEPQVEAVIDSMNCGMKSEIEAEVIEQEKLSMKGVQTFRTTIMFSATMKSSVEKLAQKYMRFPATVKVGDKDTGKNRNIKQVIHMVREDQKHAKLVRLVRETPPPVIVFANSKRGCDQVGRYLNGAGLRAVVLHSGKMQEKRESNLSGFKEGKYDILVATDVAGRGLDIQNVRHVVNFDMASNIERYTHRIGRTGRAGKTGVASTLLTDSDGPVFYELVEYLKSTKSEVPHELARHPMSSVKPGDVVDQKKLDRLKKQNDQSRKSRNY